MSSYESIAIVRLSAMGDIIHALPVANVLRLRYPASRISWIVDTRYEDILKDYKDIDEIIPINTTGWKEGVKGLCGMMVDIRRLYAIFRKRRFSLALDLQGLIKSGIITAMIGAEKKIGFDRAHCREPLSAFFTDTHITPQEDTHIIDKNLSLLEGLGINTAGWKFRIPVKREHGEYVKGFFSRPEVKKSSLLIGINPGAGWETKRWGAERFSRLADDLTEKLDATIVLVWGPGEKPLVEEIRRRMKKESFIAPPTTVRELAALIRRLDLLVAGDTGPLHLAAALGIKTVSIFGPTDPRRNGPYGPGHKVLYVRTDCGGCHKRTCNDFHCLDPITPEMALSACQQQLEKVAAA